MLKFDRAILSEALAVKLKRVLLFLVVPCKTAHVNGRFIDDRGLLVWEITEVCDLAKLRGYLTKIDFEIIFDFMNHNFRIAIV